MNKKAKIGIAVAALAVIYSATTITGTGQSVTITDDAILVGNFTTVTIRGSGTADNPLDVNGGMARAKCVRVEGNYIRLHGLDVTGCSSHGIFVSGDYNVIEDNNIHGNVTENGIFPSCGTGGQFGSALKVYVGAEHNTIKNNNVWENCGEGIGVTRGIYTTVQGNAVRDNYSVNLYVDNSPYTDVVENTVECVNATKSGGIGLGEEYYSGWGAQRHNVNIVSNTVRGCDVGIAFLISDVGGAAQNIYIANNSIPNGIRRSISIQSVNQNVTVENNQVFNSVYVSNPAGVTVRNNTVAIPPTQTASPTPTRADGWIVVQTGQTITEVIARAQSGDVIIVPAGDYPELVTLSKSGIEVTANGAVTMRGWLVSGNNNVISGFTICNPSSNYGIMVTGYGNLFERNEIYHTKQDGIWFFGHDNTFRGNYIHDILDPSISGDPHVDCFQTWGWDWETYNILFEGNKCDHTRTSGSNQIVMIANQSQWPIRGITFTGNTFIMHDAGYSPMNFVRKDGQMEISNVSVTGNTFINVTGNGNDAIRFSGITGGEITNNISTGYGAVAKLVNSNAVVFGNVMTETVTPSSTPIPTPTATATPTLTPTITPTPTYECHLFQAHDQIVCLP